MGFFRRLFGGGEKRYGEPAASGESGSDGGVILEREHLERIGTDGDLMRDYDAQAERNMQAADAEQRGDVETAISLYEQNVREEFVGAFPYERLASIYAVRRPGDALRVTEAFITLTGSGRLPKGSQRSAERRLQEFEARRDELQGRQSR